MAMLYEESYSVEADVAFHGIRTDNILLPDLHCLRSIR